MIYLLCVLIGVVAGLRALMAPTAVSWAAWSRGIDLTGSWIAFLGYRWTPYIFTIAALAEIVTDQLPGTPSRKVPPQFAARIIFGGLSGAALGAGSNSIVGAICGVAGAVVGTFAGAAFRVGVAAFFGRDRPAAIIEDVVAIVLALVVVSLA